MLRLCQAFRRLPPAAPAPLEKKGQPGINRQHSSACRKGSKAVMWHVASPEVQAGHQGSSSQSQCPGKALLSCFAKGTFSTRHMQDIQGGTLSQAPDLLGAVGEVALSLAMAFFQGWKDPWTVLPG